MHKDYFVYILYSEYLDKYYVGSTSNVEERLKKHLQNHRGFTGKAKDWKICYQESFKSREEAIVRELKIKGWKSRKMIVNLIRGSG